MAASGLVAELSYPSVLWARSKDGRTVWGEFEGEPGVCWILAQTVPRNVRFPNAEQIEGCEWYSASIEELLEEARRIDAGKGKSGERLVCMGVVVDFERRVWCR